MNRWLLRLLATALFVLPGCDFGADDETISIQDDVVFRFEFEADDVTVGEPFEVTSSATQSVQAALANQGFDVDQVISARTLGGVAEVLFPLDAAISILDQLSVSVQAGDALSNVVVDNLAVPADEPGDSINLTADATVDIGPQLREGSFSGVLMFVANTGLQPGESYELAVELQLSIEVAFQ
jgi:hypothetical protein